MSDAPEISLVLPCLDEARTLPACLASAAAAIAANGLDAEIVVVDNGSRDGSDRIALEAGARLVRVAEPGYGAALAGGIAAARGRFIVMGDADGSYDWSAIRPFVDGLRDGCDLVMGCRLPSGGGSVLPGAMPWQNRVLGNPVLTGVGRLLFRSPVRDFHCGFRAVRKAFVDELDLRTTGMEFASEMVVKATLRGGRIAEVPVTLHPDGRGRPSHLRPWRDGWRHLRFMLLFSPPWLFLLPGGLLTLLGALGVLIATDAAPMLAAAASLLVGYQLVIHAVFSRVLAMSEGLRPPGVGMRRIFSLVTLETGLVVGVLLCAFGVVRALTALDAGGGVADAEGGAALRRLATAAIAFVMGVQTVLASFFLSMLGVRRR